MRTKYFHTPETDAVIREVYQNPAMYFSRSLTVAAKRLGWPRFVIKNRASRLGVARTKETPWTNEELRILDRWAHLGPERIRLKLKAAGYQRTNTAIIIKRKRLHLRSTLGGYSANQLSELMGIDSHAIVRWIENHWLRAERRGTERTHDMWYIPHGSVFHFLVEHPNEYHLAKLDKAWFLDLITQGKAVWTGEYDPAIEKAPAPRLCLECGAPLTNQREKFCTLNCCEQYRWKHTDKETYNRQRREKRRAREVQAIVPVEPQPEAVAVEAALQLEPEPIQQASTHKLSPRERQVLASLLTGLRLTEIAHRLGISIKTVDTFKTSLMRKLQVRNRIELGQFALQHNLTKCQTQTESCCS